MFGKFKVSFYLILFYYLNFIYCHFRAKYIRPPINVFSSLSTIVQLPKEIDAEEEDEKTLVSFYQQKFEYVEKMTKTLTLNDPQNYCQVQVTQSDVLSVLDVVSPKQTNFSSSLSLKL